MQQKIVHQTRVTIKLAAGIRTRWEFVTGKLYYKLSDLSLTLLDVDHPSIHYTNVETQWTKQIPCRLQLASFVPVLAILLQTALKTKAEGFTQMVGAVSYVVKQPI